MMQRLLGLALMVWLGLVYAQVALPAAKLGLTVTQDNSGATTFSKPGLELTYVPGVGWTPPLDPSLPAPVGGRLPLEVVRAAGLIAAPEAGVRLSSDPNRLRLVLDLPAGTDPATVPVVGLTPYGGRLQLNLPYFLPGLEGQTPPNVTLSAQYGQGGTSLSLQAPPLRVYRYRSFTLDNPARLVLDVYYLEPERAEPVAPGITYREFWAWTPDPLRMYVLEAAPGSWRMEPVGRPGVRQTLDKTAPNALAVLNGGYFDAPTGTPIGLWIKDGVAINFPYGRSALFWDEENLFAGLPRFSTVVRTADGRSFRVGINLTRGKYTAYTIPGPAGKPGESVLAVKGDRVVASYPAPYTLPAGYWALSYPPAEPIAAPGDILKLYGSLEPPTNYALEAGPLLIQGGENVFRPDAEPFRDKAPLLKVAPQSAVAWTQTGTVWLVVTAPTLPGVLAQVLAEQGAWGAIRMDGGGSAQLWVRGRLRNPSDGVRPVVSGLALYSTQCSPTKTLDPGKAC
ncbi:phosphodiester glycosidase family protein [Meiothermus granaticius]|uniref:Phosphodiester glycosidase n=2 Tax=Meiothermus TaxID=65551 RepID=A0A399FC86_9DEIN|nr:phosphodiester glycosidase family protein [Meiothermus granaticius]RIH93848.1 Phosphodiester glycosidase [Meiothermus granaticius NBRC 107808]GEM86345.1 hypothetical protein MGR01S_09700 [Meiothermus granaticius NBRC 107808]